MAVVLILLERKVMSFLKTCIYLILIFLISNSLSSKENLGDIVVTPNRSLVELSKVGSSVLLINKKQIDSSAATTTSSILQEFLKFHLKYSSLESYLFQLFYMLSL